METGFSPARTYADPALSRARRFARYVRVNPSLPSQRAVLTIAFLSFALPLCILLALLTPPGQVADEPRTRCAPTRCCTGRSSAIA